VIRKLDRDYFEAELQAINALVDDLPANDVLGRRSLESRRDEVVRKLEAIDRVSVNRAQVALYFGGDPVIGSAGVQAGFSAGAIINFQDLITKVWAAAGGALRPMGPVPDKELSQLHITQLVHGSFGFLFEELDEQGEPMFETPLRRAADTAISYVSRFADESEARFTEVIEEMDQRVFQAVRNFFSVVHKGKATFRVVEGDLDARFDRVAIERAWQRVEETDVNEQTVRLEGRLLGVIPIGRRFEFEPDARDRVIRGKIGEQFTELYLERINREQLAGRRWRALFERMTVERPGRPVIEKFTLLELDAIPQNGA
jgi:hypothetical protein